MIVTQCSRRARSRHSPCARERTRPRYRASRNCVFVFVYFCKVSPYFHPLIHINLPDIAHGVLVASIEAGGPGWSNKLKHVKKQIQSSASSSSPKSCSRWGYSVLRDSSRQVPNFQKQVCCGTWLALTCPLERSGGWTWTSALRSLSGQWSTWWSWWTWSS